jgi:hypothetical protein
MKVGDLVKMKYTTFWALKSNPRIAYTESIATVIKSGSHIMEIMWSDGTIHHRDKDLFEVIK